MKAMAQCKRCGKKGFFLELFGDGLCRACYDKEQEMQEQFRADELRIATQVYDETAVCYQRALQDPYASTLKELRESLVSAERCCELLRTWDQTPRITEALLNDGYQWVDGEIDNNVFRTLPVQSGKVRYDKILNLVMDQIAQKQDIIRKSTEFEMVLGAIRQSPPPVATALPFEFRTDVPLFKESNITARTRIASVNTFVAIDTETTGLSITEDEIIQISTVKFVNFQPIEAWTSYVKPKKGLKARAQEINHITDEDVRDAPDLEEAISAFDAYLEGTSPIVGHNLSFDYNFLLANGSRVMAENILGKRKFFDTLSLAKREYRSSRNSLDYLCRVILHIARDDAHSALSDAVAAGLLFSDICRRRVE